MRLLQHPGLPVLRRPNRWLPAGAAGREANLTRVLEATVKGPQRGSQHPAYQRLRRPWTSDVSRQPPQFSPGNGRLPQSGTAAYQGSPRGLVSAGSHLRPARTMYRWRPWRTDRIRSRVDQTWTKAWLASRLPIPSGRRMPPELWSWRPGSRSAGRYSRADHLAKGTTRSLTRVAEKVALTRSR